MIPASPDPRSRSAGLRQVVALDEDGRPCWHAVLVDERGEDREPERLAAAAAADAVAAGVLLTRAHLDADGKVVSIQVTQTVAPKAPEMWFAEVVEAGPPTALNLVAFTGLDVPNGAVLDATAQHDVAGLSADQQIGAIRWYPETGELDQVYVSPDWRRRSIATALMGACATHNLATGGPMGWGDGQRTALGEKWRNSHRWGHRAADLTHLAPPMTPFDQR